jgi:hypothetical protein
LRRPRTKQRFPRGGEELYELLRMDHEPACIYVRRTDQTTGSHARVLHPNGLMHDPDTDPLIYFWPVEKQFVWVQFDHNAPEEERKRLVKALMRDGATWLVVTWHEPNSEVDPVLGNTPKTRLAWDSHGDPDTWFKDRGLDPTLPQKATA